MAHKVFIAALECRSLPDSDSHSCYLLFWVRAPSSSLSDKLQSTVATWLMVQSGPPNLRANEFLQDGKVWERETEQTSVGKKDVSQ